MPNIIITDENNFKKTKEKISAEGVENFHIIADFDRTLTRAFVNGELVPSLISILRSANMLTPDYAEKATLLFKKYHAIEIDNNISQEKKATAMKKWWQEHFKLLIAAKLHHRDLEAIASSPKIQLRTGAAKLLRWSHEHNVPLMIFSSSGLGTETIPLYLKKMNCLYPNIHVVSNGFEWDKDGYAVRHKEPFIHTLNKGEYAIEGYPIFNLIKNRKDILLLGDSIGDLQMANTRRINNIINVGFLNEKIEDNLEEYKKYFDVLILNDGEMDFVNQLLEELF